MTISFLKDFNFFNCCQLEKVEDLLADAVNKGAKVLAGGKRTEGPGFFFPPTIITNVTREMKIWTEEVIITQFNITFHYFLFFFFLFRSSVLMCFRLLDQLCY